MQFNQNILLQLPELFVVDEPFETVAEYFSEGISVAELIYCGFLSNFRITRHFEYIPTAGRPIRSSPKTWNKLRNPTNHPAMIFVSRSWKHGSQLWHPWKSLLFSLLLELLLFPLVLHLCTHRVWWVLSRLTVLMHRVVNLTNHHFLADTDIWEANYVRWITRSSELPDNRAEWREGVRGKWSLLFLYGSEYQLFICSETTFISLQLEYTFTEDVTGPLHVYYELQNFYQNHRRYVSSRDSIQLEGTVSFNCNLISQQE